jgi:hypothetical protein
MSLSCKRDNQVVSRFQASCLFPEGGNKEKELTEKTYVINGNKK